MRVAGRGWKAVGRGLRVGELPPSPGAEAQGRHCTSSHGAWSGGTHCVFCMLFSIPFHPLPELSVHGLQGSRTRQPIRNQAAGMAPTAPESPFLPSPARSGVPGKGSRPQGTRVSGRANHNSKHVPVGMTPLRRELSPDSAVPQADAGTRVMPADPTVLGELPSP